ncbi:MAG: inositol monophosphatase [Candidatus Micrarchaeota archaeon]|nr:inositol monophosphatase [Candidatus Micrarchaeota archaeon]
MANFEKETRIAKSAIESASKILLKYSKRVEHIRSYAKGADDYATEADIAAEREIIKTIRGAFPSHRIFSEEKGEIKGTSEYKWIVDPLDGTRNFKHQLPLWGTMLSLTLNGKPLVSVISLPVLGETYVAVEGEGAFLNGRRIRVSKQANIKKAMMIFDGMHVYKNTDTRDLFEATGTAFGSSLKVLGCGAVGGAYIARGGVEGMIMIENPPHDVLPIVGIVTEAGGRISDLDGKEWKPESKHCFVSNGAAHDKMLKALLIELARVRG